MKKYHVLIFTLSLIISVTEIFPQKNLQLLSRIPYTGRTLAGCWHYVDTTGIEYAIVGTSTAISIVDVSIPTAPVIKFEVPSTAPGNLWQELKVWGKYAYCGTEGGGGINIIDLSKLPDTVYSKTWTGDSIVAGLIGNSHTVAVDNGYLYIFGASAITNKGAIICSLADPWNPKYAGQYDATYIHDGYIRNNRLYSSDIYAGQFSVIDVTNKSAPSLLASQATPGLFNHNSWLSDNSQYIFTADEKYNVPLGSFDISNLANIKLLDKYYTVVKPTREVHNVRVLNDYLVNACYGSQVTIVDANKPDNLVEIAYHSTGSNGLCWDVDPYLPSGVVLASDKDSGLYIFSTVYHRACYLEGIVRDSITNNLLNLAQVEILASPIIDSTILTGEYKTGYADAGIYSVRFSKPGYHTRSINGVTLTPGNVTTLNVRLLDSLYIGINEKQVQNDFTLFPNPAKNTITVSTTSSEFKKGIFTVFDVLGAEKYKAAITAKQTILNLEKLSPGMYLYSIKDEKGNVLKEDKLVINY